MAIKGNSFLIDICGTIFKSNTTFDFVKYCFGHKKKVKLWFSLPYRIYNRLMYRCFCREPLRNNLISLLNGISRERLDEMAEEFYNDYLLKRVNGQTLGVIEQWRSQGADLIIVSATIDVIAQMVARHYGIDVCLSTRLNYSADGQCEGTIAYDLLPHKKDALDAEGVMPPYAGIITDNYSDVKLVKASRKAYLITYDKNINKWKELLTTDEINRCEIVYV